MSLENQENTEYKPEEPSFEQLAACVMLEFICSKPEYVAEYKVLFQQRIADYFNGGLDGLKYVIDITDMGEEKLH